MYRVGEAGGGAGKGLFADRKLVPGMTIFELPRPLVTAVDTPALAYTCEWCFDGVGEAGLGQSLPGVEETKLLRCSGCKIVKYCRKAQAWKHHHKLECKIFASLLPRVLPNAPRMLLQLLLRRRKGSLGKDEWERFTALRSHINGFYAAPAERGDLQKLRVVAMGVKQYGGGGVEGGGTEPMAFYEELAAKVFVNAQTVVSAIFHPLGQCLDPLPATLNHSCEPNAVVSFDGATMSLRATAGIAEGAEITISYIDSTFDRDRRRQELADRYFFTCNCPGCKEDRCFGLPRIPVSLTQSPDALAAVEALDAAALALRRRGEAALVDARNQHQPGGSENPAGSVGTMAKAQQTHYESLCSALALYLGQEPGLLAAAYPRGRQPLASLRLDVTVELLARGEFLAALLLGLQTYADADPVHFAWAGHPVRAVRAYVLSKMAGQIGYVLTPAVAAADRDRDIVAFAQAFGMPGTRWAEASMALLGEAHATVPAGHRPGGRLDVQCRGECAAALAGGLVPKAARALLMDQSLDGDDGDDGTRAGAQLGLRDAARWPGPARAASLGTSTGDGGWAWYARLVSGRPGLDPGLRILTAPRPASAPVLVRP